ncbi:hypothetical protein [Actinacidiphila glaucinigra]|uniref:hypothetical protein n=1 Tax=Actinacidiphila glaucinigra TaxID=235986 RepID=UPI00366C170E
MSLFFFMLQRYIPPTGDRTAAWEDTATRYVELKPRRNSGEADPVAAWAVRHMKSRRGGPYRVRVKEYVGRYLRQQFVVHSDGTRTPIGD